MTNLHCSRGAGTSGLYETTATTKPPSHSVQRKAIANTLRHTTQQSSRLCTLDLSCRIFLYAGDAGYLERARSALEARVKDWVGL